MSNRWVVTGRGTGANKSDTNGGGYVRGSSRTWADFQGANAGPIDTASTAVISDNGSGSVRLTLAGAFSSSLVDVLAYCNFAAVYTDGHYAVTAVDASGNYIDIDLAYSAATTADVNVGGALSDIDTATGLLADGDQLDITAETYTTTSNVNSYMLECKNTITSTTDYIALQNVIVIRGVEEDTGEPDFSNPLVFNCADTLNGVLLLSRYSVHNVEVIDAVGDGFAGTGDYERLYRCSSHGCSGHGYAGDDSCQYIGCDAYDNGGHGISGDNGLFCVACNSHDNTLIGIDGDGECVYVGCRCYDNLGGYQFKSNYARMEFNVAWDTTNGGFLFYLAEQGPYLMNIYGNVADGRSTSGVVGLGMFGATNPGWLPLVQNNAFINCATAITSGYTFNGKMLYTNNAFYNNTAKFNADAEGFSYEEITADPLFTNAPNGDYTLQATSPLREQGLDFAIPAGLTSNLISIGYYNSSEATVAAGGRRSRAKYIGIGGSV